ncbi:hypothetical protein ACW4E8_15595 [Cupriavidus sp. CP313]
MAAAGRCRANSFSLTFTPCNSSNSNFLAPGGRLAAVMAAGVRFRSNRLAESFRDLINARRGQIEPLREGAFKASGTMVNTVIATIPALAG